MTERKSLLEQAIDVCICAPVGLAITVTEEFPQLIDKGRARVTSQFSLAKMVGSFAVAYGQREAERVVRQAAGRVQQPAREAGPRTTEPTREAAPKGSSAPTSEPAQTADEATTSLDGKATPSHLDGTGSDGAYAVGSHTGAPPAGDSATLAIPGYDALSASQVVQRLAGLAPEELEAVRTYEAATRARRTILNRVSQLQADGEG